ncbi:MAG: DUF4382 domain-containing protein [Acidobacteriota bacterium]|nr:DUF4382 domain-containing protein [Acidobacteriota bacterium]MDQ7088721.1 DUF4382 domain-containing protein [Acidobacteriota bacterium]
MSRKVILLVALVALLGMFTLGCNTDDPLPVQKTGTVSVTLDTSSSPAPATEPTVMGAVAAATEVNVTFSALTLYNSGGSPSVDLFTQPVTLNLLDYTVAQLLGDYPVPPGTYNCIDADIDMIQVVEGANTCTLSNPGFDLPGVCLGTGFLTVQEDGTYSLVYQVPVVNASCPSDGGIPSFTFGDPNVSLPNG